MRRWFALQLAGALTVLGSLYLPWQDASCGTGCVQHFGGVGGVLNSFAGDLSIDGWQSGVGDAAAVAGLAVATAAAIAWVRPALVSRLPFGLLALATAYFAAAVAVAARSTTLRRDTGTPGIAYHYAYGAYVGLAAAAVVLLAAGLYRRHELTRRRSTSELATIVLVGALLVAFLLPWERGTQPVHFTIVGLAAPAASVAAVLALSLLRVDRPVIAAAAGLFAVGAFSSFGLFESHAYGAWIGLGVAIALIARAMPRRVAPDRRKPTWRTLIKVSAAALFIAAMFMPWQRACYQSACYSVNGWTYKLVVAAALLALGLFVAMHRSQAAVVAAGLALFVAAVGFELGQTRAYGSVVGFVAAGLLVAGAVVEMCLNRVAWRPSAVLVLPIVTCAAYVAVVVVPWWDVLPRRLEAHLGFAPPSWMSIAGILLAILLLRLWIQRDDTVDPGALVVAPLLMLWLATLDLIRLRDEGITWGNGIVVGLCLVLALLGRAQQREGLDSWGVPELLRVDRL